MSKVTIGESMLGKGLAKFTEEGDTKTEFLLRSILAFYSNTIENIREKRYSNDDVIMRLREYIPVWQGSKKIKKKKDKEAVIMKIKSTGKQCEYCKKYKGWLGKWHTEENCYTKKREDEKKK